MIFDIRKLLLANPGYNQLVTKDEFETKFKLDWSKIVKEYHDCDGRLPIRFDAVSFLFSIFHFFIRGIFEMLILKFPKNKKIVFLMIKIGR